MGSGVGKVSGAGSLVVREKESEWSSSVWFEFEPTGRENTARRKMGVYTLRGRCHLGNAQCLEVDEVHNACGTGVSD